MKLLTRLSIPAALVCSCAIAQSAETETTAPREVTREFFSGKDFSGENLADSKFFQVRMNGANFRGADLSDASFDQCDLAGADLREVVMTDDTSFKKVLLNDSNLEGVDVAGADFDSANLRGANLRNTKNYDNINRASFDGADIRGADFSAVAVPLVEVTWIGAIYDTETKFPEGVDPQAVEAVLE